jgi:hypothetical protein
MLNQSLSYACYFLHVYRNEFNKIALNVMKQDLFRLPRFESRVERQFSAIIGSIDNIGQFVI